MKNAISLSLVCLTLALSSCSKENKIDDDLKEVAANINKTAPQTLADGVRLDSVSAQPGKIFRYNYTLTDDTKEGVSPEQIETFKTSAKEGALQVIKTSPEIKEFRDNDVTMVYTYYDKAGKKTADFKITPEEYKTK
ncbi:hypothetical protein [Chryseobacterium hagamense]|uniref:Lipoprotein n=1 Tax=Chryseobacterium hagamense TaxID=395935 RepID=A0A511YQH7_9FLAO|nr:hypothetical protein [Chryseobacterium hagamense]GEN77441.1 hypothetical protein CHA01nite_31810 [Chryseobacterium hagamense]